MAGRRECQGALPPRPIKALCATSAGRNSRGIKNERSKSAAKTRGTALTRWALRIVARGADEDDPRCMSCVTPWIEA